jgi:hypothetical protein
MDRPALKAAQLGLADFRYTSARDISSGRDCSAYDAVVAERQVVPIEEIGGLVATLRERNIRFVVDIDDDLFSDYAEFRLVPIPVPLRYFPGMRFAIQHADLVLASTQPLARRVMAWAPGVAVAVAPNRLDGRLWATGRGGPVQMDSPKPAVYFGTATHGLDLELIAALPGLLTERLGQKVGIDIVGVTDGKLPAGCRAVWPKDLRYPAWYEPFSRWMMSQGGRWSVGLAPLADEYFNECKSDVKLLEYSALGLPAVASQWGPYSGGAEFAVLCDDSPETWADAVASLMTPGDNPLRAARLASQRNALAGRILTAQSVTDWVDAILGRDAQESGSGAVMRPEQEPGLESN